MQCYVTISKVLKVFFLLLIMFAFTFKPISETSLLMIHIYIYHYSLEMVGPQVITTSRDDPSLTGYTWLVPGNVRVGSFATVL